MTHRISWMTDIHLDHLSVPQRNSLGEQLSALDVDGLAITGDISSADSLEEDLEWIDSVVNYPVYFVLGNHDCYDGSIAGSHKLASDVAKNSRHLKYFDADHRVYEIGPTTCVVGHNGWADGRLGYFMASRVQLNDYYLIEEFKNFNSYKILIAEELMKQSDAAAAFIKQSLEISVPVFDNILVLTHVPPFRSACVHEGQVSNDEWLPHFSSKSFGEALLPFMHDHPEKTMTVLCGHTHGDGVVNIASNLTVHTGGAQYGRPRIQPYVYDAK